MCLTWASLSTKCMQKRMEKRDKEIRKRKNIRTNSAIFFYKNSRHRTQTWKFEWRHFNGLQNIILKQQMAFSVRRFDEFWRREKLDAASPAPYAVSEYTHRNGSASVLNDSYKSIDLCFMYVITRTLSAWRWRKVQAHKMNMRAGRKIASFLHR